MQGPRPAARRDRRAMRPATCRNRHFRWHPNQCWEVKSGGAVYWGTLQWKKDMEIMAVFKFPIRVIWSWGIMEWP